MKKNSLVRVARVVIFSGVIIIGWAANTAIARAATLTLSPATQTINVGSTFAVNILLDTAGQQVYGVDIYSLRFNPAVLQVVDADTGTAGIQISPGSLMSSTQFNSVNNSAGTIQFSQTPAAASANYNGQGILATITFQGAAAGVSAATFDFTSGATTDTNVAGLYSDLLTSVTNANYTVAALDTSPPVISSVASSAVTQSAATITWTTDESSDSQVEYGTTAGYGATSTLNSSLVTSHSIALSALLSGTLYHYRVRSRDAAGNLAISTDKTFTTVTPPDTQAPSVPTNLFASAISTSQINLSWTASTDAVGVTGYKIYRAGTQIATTTATSYSNTGLAAATAYSYTVSAYDAAGNVSTQSTSASATTQSFPDTTAPIASISSPSAGSVSGTITFAASASDPSVTGSVTSGLFSLSLLIDNNVFATSSSGSLSRTLDTATLSNGSHNLTAKALDNAGNSFTTQTVVITVYNLVNETRYPRKVTLSGLEGLAAVPANQTVIVSIISPATQAVLSTQTLSPDASGGYVVNFQADFTQIVSIRVAANGYLSRLFTGVDTTSSAAPVLTAPQMVAGDFNNDNIINTLDYSLLNAHYNQNYSACDINKDGLVNSLDFAVLKNNWNKTGE
jgi:chitodextrinase